MIKYLLDILSKFTGYSKRCKAEATWKAKHGEIPDRHCLVYDGHICRLERIY